MFEQMQPRVRGNVGWLGVLGFVSSLWALPASCVAAGVEISDSGSASYTYEIGLPPARGGFQPKLYLRYSSSGPTQGIAGVGWTLQGMSAITRCPATRPVDGLPVQVNYNDADKLCLDGQRLIQTNATGQPLPFPQTNDAADASNGLREYRLESDLNTRVRAYGTSSTGGPAYFKVISANGTVRDFGASGNNLLNSSDPYPVVPTRTNGLSMVWPISRATDASGNMLQFTYTISAATAGLEWLLSRIDYSANQGSGFVRPESSVVFTYGDRPTGTGDTAIWYQAGHPQISTKRLTKIETLASTPYMGTRATKRINLGYQPGPVTGRSTLQSITECGLDSAGAERCSPANSFTYSSGSIEFALDNSPFLDAAGAPNGLDSVALDVVSQDVVPVKAESGGGRFVRDGGVWPMEVVVRHPRLQFSRSDV